ncbi:MAG: glutathione S-transferase family protein [Gammaproteobacteria bacterium]
MITLYKFGPIGDVCDASPFCAKIEAYLRMTNLPYRALCGAENLRKAPKGKLPFIEDNGRIIADSSFILDYLKVTYGDPLDKDLAPEEKAIAHAFGKMIEEHLYWVGVHARWKLENNWPALENAFFGQIPFPANKIIARMARRNMQQQLYQQGMGRHSEEEIVAIGDRALQALADFLGTKRFFLGDKPTSLDAIAYGMLVQFIRVPRFAAPIIDRAKAYPTLVDYTERFHHLYFNSQTPAEDR